MANADLPKGAEFHYIDDHYTGVYTRVPVALTPGLATGLVVLLIGASIEGSTATHVAATAVVRAAPLVPVVAFLITFPAMRHGMRGSLNQRRCIIYSSLLFWYASLTAALALFLALLDAELVPILGIGLVAFISYCASRHLHRITRRLKWK
jgi:hypothetical protein